MAAPLATDQGSATCAAGPAASGEPCAADAAPGTGEPGASSGGGGGSKAAVREAATKMHALFPGSARSHATFTPGKEVTRDSDGKVVLDYRTVYQPITVEMWAQHIEGVYPLVIGLRSDDDTAAVSVVDDDDKDASLISIVEKIKGTGLPLYARRSKSGGAHIFAFHDRPIAADEALKVARGIGPRLGLGDEDQPGVVEFFPKPKPRNPDGNIISLNMPYLGGQFGFVRPGSFFADEMPIEEFLRGVVKMTDEQRAALIRGLEPGEETGAEEGAQHAAKMLEKKAAELAGISRGRNVKLYKVGFYLATMIPREWITREEIETALLQACETNGLMQTERQKTLDTLRNTTVRLSVE